MNKDKPQCPKCGGANIYIGATNIECGTDPDCENYTETQAKVIEQIIAAKFPKAEEVFNNEDETVNRNDTTDPMFGIPVCFYDVNSTD